LGAVPHLAELAKQYQDKVTFLALSDEKVATVRPFLAKKSRYEGKTWGEAMAYTVATDPDQSVKKEIFSAAGQRGIPASFIISDGVVQWIGHPMSMDDPLEKVVAGTWNIEAAKEERAKQDAINQLMRSFRPLLRDAEESGDWAPVFTAIDEGIEKHPGNLDLAFFKWQALIFGAERYEEAYSYGDKVLELAWDNASMLNQVAWTTVDNDSLKTRDFNFAMKAAKRAVELTEEKDGAILDTLARVYFETGNLEKAIQWQKKAVENATGSMQEQLQEVLDKYLEESKKK